MSEMTVVALDAMGGDNAPEAQRYESVIGREAGSDRGGTRRIYISERADRSGACIRGDRDGRAAGACDPQKERFVSCESDAACEE